MFVDNGCILDQGVLTGVSVLCVRVCELCLFIIIIIIFNILKNIIILYMDYYLYNYFY